mmetsp:Transcript_39020/g.59407  ORF Transcript_39020/g.59407 Transcript_39020/m.59407 type:complete len:99 (-) Transcript_39020:204-500(-)
MTPAEFVDLCILCGCDYTDSISGLGPVTAYKLVQEHHTIENVLDKLETLNKNRKKKFTVPEPFLYEESRRLFTDPNVISDKEELENLIEFKAPEFEQL